MQTWILAVVALSVAVTAALCWLLLRINAGRLSAGDVHAAPADAEDDD